MRSIKVLNETLYFAKENFNMAITVAGEGFVIQLVTQFLMFPFIFLVMFIFPIFMVGGAEPETASILFSGIYIIFIFFASAIRAIATSIVMGGEVYTLDRIKKGRKVKFGDVFKYGWKNKFPLLGIMLVNTILTGLLYSIPIGIFIVSISYLMYIPLGIFIMLFTLFLFLMLALIPFQLTLVPLPFVIRNRLGTGVFASVFEAWKFYFKNFISLYIIGLFYTMALVIASFIPFVGILVNIVVFPGVITSELILLDDILGIQRFKPRYVGQDRVMSNMPPMN